MKCIDFRQIITTYKKSGSEGSAFQVQHNEWNGTNFDKASWDSMTLHITGLLSAAVIVCAFILQGSQVQ